MSEGLETEFIGEVVEKTPFIDIPAQKIFTKWCEINDSITPQFMTREDWEQRGTQGILEKNEQGKQTLFVPEDLHLWEMIDVIKVVDYDTLARKPEQKTQRAENIRELGVTFEKAGIYLSEYESVFGKDDEVAKQIMQDVSQEFYKYGLSLQNKEKGNDDIPQESALSEGDKDQLDEWFLGRGAYRKRLARLGESPTEEQKEKLRKRTLRAYFRALAHKGYKGEGEKPWEVDVGPRQHLQDRTKRQITKAIETPEREVKTAIFRRGVEKLVTEMKEVGWRKAVNDLFKTLDIDPVLEQRRLYNTLHIDELKTELLAVRQTGDVDKISKKELEIAKKVRKAVKRFPYKEGAVNPSEMAETQFVNCIGSSILGGGFLDEVGIKYLCAHLPEHFATVLITSDGKIRWQDFTPPGSQVFNYREIRDTDIDGKNGEGGPLTVSDIVEFADNPNDEGLRFEINQRWYDVNMEEYGLPSRFMSLFDPERGMQDSILNTAGCTLFGLGKYEEAIQAYRQVISTSPKYDYPYNGLGNALGGLGKHEEAIEAYRRAISINSKHYRPYSGLGNSLSGLGKHEEAIEAYRRAISINPTDANTYYGLGQVYYRSGRSEEAVRVFRRAISVDPKFTKTYYDLGEALQSMGKKEEAIKAFGTFIRRGGDKYWVGRARARQQQLKEEK